MRRRRADGPAIRLLGTLLLAAGALAATAGCARVTSATGNGRDGAAALDGPGGNTALDAGTAFDSSCRPVSCTPAGGRYCGVIGDGCFGTEDCGACPGDGVCTAGICVGGPSCAPLTCAPAGAQYCGTVGDGCGRALDCGACGADQACSAGICVPLSGCTPLGCDIAGGGRYCGQIGDGCGGTLDCGSCTAPQTCGGGGVTGVCGAPASLCTPLSCTPPGGGQYCGTIGNGCGGTQQCPDTCPMGATCTADHVCPSSQTTCTNLQCQIDKCDGGASTTISGTVFDPAGRNPLYNVVLYVPNAPLDPIRAGASCDRCDSPISGRPVAAALSDAQGHFHIENAPSGTNIPLVIQIGKWRRQLTLPEVRPCQDNVFADSQTVRLPRTQSEGNMPLIALSTGHADTLDCLLRKIGIADSEFTNDAGGGRVHMYVGGAGVAGDQGSKALASGAVFADSYQTLFTNYAKLASYDLLVLTCEGEQLTSQKLPLIPNMRRYADNGGRIFFSHLHSAWIRLGLPPWPATAQWIGGGAADLTTTAMPTITGFIDTTFAKGGAMADWLVATGASATRGQLPLVQAQNSVDAVFSPTQRWIHTEAPIKATAQYLTFNTPLESAAANQCGRAVFTDVHVGGGDTLPFPTGCPASLDMSPQEKALEFMFFDLSSCVQVDTATPLTPPIPPPGATPPPTAVPTPPAPPPPPPPPPPPDIP